MADRNQPGILEAQRKQAGMTVTLQTADDEPPVGCPGRRLDKPLFVGKLRPVRPECAYGARWAIASLQGEAMLQYALSLRLIMLIGALGAMVGALLMFWLGGSNIVGGIRALLAGNENKIVTGLIMSATDSFLFGVVLVVFAYAIAFGFAVDLKPDMRERLPQWMRIDSVSGLKHTLVEVILVYLVVDFATDWAQAADVSWTTLLKPTSILLIAAASRLLSSSHPPSASDA